MDEDIECERSEGDSPPKKSKNNTTVEMSEEHTLYFISVVKSHPCLWNKKIEEYKMKSLKQDAWRSVSEVMNYPEEELKDKWASLRGSFRTYQSRAHRSKGAARSSKEVYNPRWFGYNAMKFLGKMPEGAKSLDTDRFTEEESEAPSNSLPSPKPQLDPSPKPSPNPAMIPSLSRTLEPRPRIVTFVNVKDNKVICKSTNPLQMENPLRIKREPQPQRISKIGPITKLGYAQHVVGPANSIEKSPTSSSVKSFVNFIEQELSQLSLENVTKAQMEIHRIIGEYKLKDISQRSCRSTQPHLTNSKRLETQKTDNTPGLAMECREEDVF